MDKLTVKGARERGWSVGRGQYEQTENDRGDGWYAWGTAGRIIVKPGRGWQTRRECLAALAQFLNECPNWEENLASQME